MPVTEQQYLTLALEDPDGHWELFRGEPRQKPTMTAEHGDIMAYLAVVVGPQLDREQFRVRVNHGHLRTSADRYYIPDFCVVPSPLYRALQAQGRALDAYAAALPLVVEVWSPSTGDYDLRQKVDGYKRRGDLEIWLLHPYERSLTRWVRQPDGSYHESHHTEGIIDPVALPGVRIDLPALFA